MSFPTTHCTREQRTSEYIALCSVKGASANRSISPRNINVAIWSVELLYINGSNMLSGSPLARANCIRFTESSNEAAAQTRKAVMVRALPSHVPNCQRITERHCFIAAASFAQRK